MTAATMHRRSAAVIAALAATVMGAAPSDAIVRRHDRPDARYIALAATVPPAVVMRRSPTGASWGIGTFIAPGWIITAAHVPELLLKVGQELPDYPGVVIKSIHIDPEYKSPKPLANDPDGKDQALAVRDLALVRVEGTADVAFTPVCTRGDDRGATVTFLGSGGTGDGLSSPPHTTDRHFRAAHNMIEHVDERTVRFTFDPPETALDLEGISGPGDSGGPAFLKVDGRWCIGAISSSQIRPASMRGSYGVREIYARVTNRRDWINSTIAAEAQ